MGKSFCSPACILKKGMSQKSKTNLFNSFFLICS